MLNWIKSIDVKPDFCADYTNLEMVKNAGFDGVDLGLGGLDFNDSDWEKKVHELRESFDKAGLVCRQIHLPCYSLLVSSEVYDEYKERSIINSFKSMSILGAKWAAYHPMSAITSDYDSKRALRDNQERLKAYLEEASKYNVGIAVENMPVFPHMPEKVFYSSNYEDHCELVDSFNSDLIGVCWDFGHANLMPYDQAKVLDIVGSRIKIVHMHNNTEMSDLHAVPCLGTVKWEELIPVLVKNRFEGPLSLEINFNQIMPQMKKDYMELCSKTADVMLNMG